LLWSYFEINPNDMFKHYFRIALRNIQNNRVFSLINITGLAFGITCSLLILLWVQDEQSYDKDQTNGKRLFIIYQRQYIDQKIDAGYYTPGLLSAELKKNIPEVEGAVGYMNSNNTTFESGDKILKLDGAWTGPDFFKMFSYPLLQGNRNTALNSISGMAISNNMAIKFFGSAAAAMGKTIRYRNKIDFRVTAVFADLPKNVWRKFDFLLNWSAFVRENSWLEDWRNNSPQTYIMLRPDAKTAQVEKKLTHFLDAYNKTQTASFRIELDMQPFGETYLHSNFVNGRFEGGRIEYVRLFSLVAIFILFIACINFMNLTTARSAKRSKEIGIRKVSGAVRYSLILQFLSEAVIITFLSVVLSVILLYLALPFFNQITGKTISFPGLNSPFWFMLAGLTLVTGVIAGSYPALFLSSFNPVQVLKGPLKFKTNTVLFRKGLVVFQFVLSIILIVCTIYISKQIDYVQHINLGYDRENLLYIPLEGNLSKQYQLFKEEIMQDPGISNVSRSSDELTSVSNATASVEWVGKDPNTTPQFTTISAGYDFVKTMNLKLVDGRELSRDFASDSSGYLINESALKIIQYNKPIGKPLTLWGQKGAIVGVLKDFHFTSLHNPIKPLIIHLGETDGGGTAMVRIKAGMTKAAITHLEKICKTLNPQFPLTYSFSDEQYQKLYKSEEIVSRLSNVFAVLAIFISCMGLLGLAMFTAEQRTREIGIRKVLGASLISLFRLLSGEFIVLVGIAILIACPIAWWAMNIWSQDFSYHIKIEWWIFLLAGLTVIFITLLTISFQSVRAAMRPVKCLRTE
jgi:putative ABC transport system permease protein